MHFSNSEIEFYRASGYLAGPRVFSDDQIAMLRERIDDILTGRISFPEHLVGETTLKSAAKGQLPSVKIVNLFRHDKVFAGVIGNEMVGTLAHDLMDGPVRLWEDQMIYKPPYDANAAVAWHRDYTYWDHVGPPELGTCWIALDDATVANGCMHVIPGSHKWHLDYSREEVDPTDNDWLLKQPGVPADLVPVAREVKAGYCHFHHCLLFHGSFGNQTDNTRRSYIMHLMPGNTRRIGDAWNPRQGPIDEIPLGGIVQGEHYPELTAPLLV